jgi:hypothetical protein
LSSGGRYGIGFLGANNARRFDGKNAVISQKYEIKLMETSLSTRHESKKNEYYHRIALWEISDPCFHY